MEPKHDIAETTSLQGPTVDPAMRWDNSVRHLVLQQVAKLPADGWLDWIREDQRQRWSKGVRLPVEAYLELPPLANASDDFVLDLVYCELMLRQEMGESPMTDEYARRFPRLAGSIGRLFALDEAFLGVPTKGVLPAAPLSPPLQMIGKYPILSVIAEGGQGVVFRALHPMLSKEVVIKWSKQSMAKPNERDQLLFEGRILARIEHPHLVRVLDFDFQEGRPFLVMESVQAITLEQYRDRVHPDPRRCAKLVSQIAKALDEVHCKGIVHRDIKPKNILIDEHDQPKLIDFGLACWKHSFSEANFNAGSVSGTLAYMAPEQARGNDDAVGPRSDVFGLGGVLYYLLTGKSPHSAQDFHTLLKDATEGKWDRAALAQTPMPARLREICTRALAPDAAERHASALDLANELETVVRRPRIVGSVAVVSILLILLIGIGLWWRSPGLVKTGETVQKGPPNPIERLETPSALAVDVVRKKNGPAFPVQDANPVITGDNLRLSTNLPAGRHGAFAHFSEGKWTLLAQVAPESAARTVAFPHEPGTRVPLLGNAGPEFLLFCARKAKAIETSDLNELVPDIRAFPAQQFDQVLFTLNEREVKQWHRGVLGKPAKSANPEYIAFAQLERIRNALQSQYDAFAGVLFVHKSPEE